MKTETKERYIKSSEAEELELMKEPQSETDIMYEDTRKREKNTKHFRLKNGNYRAVIYDHPVHKYDEESGRFVDIPTDYGETENDYEAEFENYKVKFPKKDGKRRFITVNKGEKRFSWRYAFEKEGERNTRASAHLHSVNKNKWDNERAHIKYEKIDGKSDLEYSVNDGGIKESIILSGCPENFVFSFEIKMHGLVPRLSENKKRVELVSDKAEFETAEAEMVIPEPNMIDNNGAYSEELHYEIRKTEKGTFLDVVANNAWLADPDRVYPVTVDPVIEIGKDENYGSVSSVEMIIENGVIVSCTYDVKHKVGVDSTGKIHRAFLGWSDYPILPDGYKITKAGVKLFQSYLATDEKYSICMLDKINDGIKVNQLGTKLSLEDIEGTEVCELPNSSLRQDIDLTDLISEMLENTNIFPGIMIKKKNEDPVCGQVCNADGQCETKMIDSMIEFYSRATEREAYRPQIYIEYKSEDMYSDNQKYHTFEVGRAGTGSINLLTGNLSFAHGDVSIEGTRLPLSVSHLYRDAFLREDSSENNDSTEISNNCKYGKGWRLSAEQTLEFVNDNGIVAVYTNARGKRHYFVLDENSNKIIDESGLGLELKEECLTINNVTQCYDLIVDEKNNKMFFDEQGRLFRLKDANGNTNTFEYQNDNLVKMYDFHKDAPDQPKNTINFEYYAGGKLRYIIDANNRRITYVYEGENLREILYPSDEEILITSFEYDSDNRLHRIIDYSGTICEIGYGEAGKVTNLSYSGTKSVSNDEISVASSAVEDGSISFEYGKYSTAIVDNETNVKMVYRLDEMGREKSSYQDLSGISDISKITETTRTEISGYSSVSDYYADLKIVKYKSLSVSLNNDANDEVNLLKNGFFDQSSVTAGPDDWEYHGLNRYECGISSNSYIANKSAFKFYNPTENAERYISQSVPLCPSHLKGNVLVASVWTKVENDTGIESLASTKYRLIAEVTYGDGTVDSYEEKFDPKYPGWQYAAIPFICRTDTTPIAATVKLEYSSNAGACFFTNARLVSVNGIITENKWREDNSAMYNITVFEKSVQAKKITVTQDGVLTTWDYIDENSDIVCNEIHNNGKQYKTYYQYDSNHNVIKTEDYRGLVIEYAYNECGKETERKTYHKDNPNAYMYSEHTYQNGVLVESESDPRYSVNGDPLVTTYQHDASRNLLLKQTSVNGQEYNYSYDDKTDDLKTFNSEVDDKKAENQFFYKCGYLTKVSHNGFGFKFAYDELGRSKSISVSGNNGNDVALVTMNYSKLNNGNRVETTYASGAKTIVTSDIFGNPTESSYIKDNTSKVVSSITYDGVGRVKNLLDNEREVCYNYQYDEYGNVKSVIETDSDNSSVTNTFVYDEDQRLVSKTYGATSQVYKPIYEYKKNDSGANVAIYPDNEVLGIELEGKFADCITKDGLRRTLTKVFSTASGSELFTETYGYLKTAHKGKTIETDIVSDVSYFVSGTDSSLETYNYTYDKAGNLEKITKAGQTVVKYYYDGLNRLRREDNYIAQKTTVLDYDEGGNIIFKKEYALTTDLNLGNPTSVKNYVYKTDGWRDQLLAYNGQNCVYDAMGNPTTYRGKSLTWTKVRRLASYDNGAVTFAYGANGIRYRKNNTVYTLDGNKILRESDGIKTLTYYHGGSGIVGFNYNGTDYYFRKSLQGDVEAIYTATGTKVADYVYDAWGKVLSVNNYTADNIGNINPIRYRSYYYDVETSLYYLNSRYYDPETGRFINADTTDVLENAKYDINGLNLYAYCDNNPVAGRDDEGDTSFWKKLAMAVAVVVVVAAVAATVAAATAATGGAAGAALCAITSTFVGAAKGAAVGAIVGAASGAVIGGVQGAVEGYQETGTLDGTLRGMGRGALKGAVQGAADGFISGMMSGAVAGAMNPSFCFVAGTAVLTTLGKKAIETIQVGDIIPCVDHITGEAAEKKVISTTVNKVNRLIELDIDGEIIQCTETHPFQVKGRGWVDASELTPNDVVYTKDWNTATIQSVNLLELDEPVEVYNFEVEDCHTYFVGGFGLLVHNGCKQQLVAGDKKGWNARVSVGGEANHATPHAHIFFKNQKLASVSETGEILVQSFGKIKGGPKFIANNLDDIAKGIQTWWFYGG